MAAVLAQVLTPEVVKTGGVIGELPLQVGPGVGAVARCRAGRVVAVPRCHALIVDPPSTYRQGIVTVFSYIDRRGASAGPDPTGGTMELLDALAETFDHTTKVASGIRPDQLDA